MNKPGTNQIILVFLLAFLLFSCQQKTAKNDKTYEADVIIYGGTSAAITAAVQTVKMGKSVIVVSPDKHLGGLTSGGLGYTDTGNKAVIGGLSREFYHRVWQHYNTGEAWKWEKNSDYGNRGQGTIAMDGENRTMWIFEPSVAEQVMEDFIAENNITVYRDEWLNRENGVTVKNGKIVSFKTLSGKSYTGKIFIDATYEGDLMASAGVSYHVGRESNSVYNETWNGFQPGVKHHKHWFMHNISPYRTPGDPNSGVVYGVSTENTGVKGEGDNKIQAYCFRMCMSRHPDNRVPFPKPANYDASKYELLLRSLQAGRPDFFEKLDAIPNKKTDTNNHGPFSSDFIGMNYDYPEASYERRQEIIQEHRDYQAGLLWFVANDPRMPEYVKTEMVNWGLAKDEFTDNDNWPHQIYVREARRMIGEYVTTENDVLLKREVPRSVGMGSYAMDSHNVQRYITAEGFVQNEGDIGVKPPAPYAISYGSLLPKKEECSNLLVPVCVSSSHIAFGSIRMEPVFMILGQSAATAAVLALEKNIGVHELNYNELKVQLEKDGQVLEYVKK
ncbi:FAD-dependent oxidoreductase [uncultured Draconibacterium sp.]|uniref:FAD-dependent oxidoreductase n=1 Tax=uncultured Draconibacterium sp. TaxID=1573823 RepID=UPI002AA8AA13|nr:FAD-dependent oxidoreductase [uncultured Draconibacterium sp.]